MSSSSGERARATLRVPPPRASHPVARLARAAWTLPTNLFGHVAGVLTSGTLGTRIASPRAVARVYVVRGPLGRALGAVTLGHAILMNPSIGAGLRGRVILAHELAHTRQHDLLGPLYLPLHIAAQVASAILWRRRPVPGSTPVHAYNPLEQRFLFLGFGAIAELLRGERMAPDELEALLSSLGV